MIISFDKHKLVYLESEYEGYLTCYDSQWAWPFRLSGETGHKKPMKFGGKFDKNWWGQYEKAIPSYITNEHERAVIKAIHDNKI